MSLTTDPDPSGGCPAFIPLEANPQLMTTLIHKLGISDALEMHDVYSLTDPDLLAFIPRPALALLLVFPVSAVYESHRMAEDSLADEYKGRGDTEPVLWWPQTIKNACGMMGLLHAITNGNARNFIRKLTLFGYENIANIYQRRDLPSIPSSRRACLSIPTAAQRFSNPHPSSRLPTRRLLPKEILPRLLPMTM
jgi:hypothetical protein